MYVSKKNTLEIPFDFKTYMGGRKEKALVDSGAMENFIDYKTVKWLKPRNSLRHNRYSMWMEPTTKLEQSTKQYTSTQNSEKQNNASNFLSQT
jgi:hypothetical protein